MITRAFSLVFLFLIFTSSILAQDREEGFFSEEDINAGFFDPRKENAAQETNSAEQDFPREPAKEDSPKQVPKPELPAVAGSSAGSASQAASVINRVKGMLNNSQGAVSPASVIDQARNAEKVPSQEIIIKRKSPDGLENPLSLSPESNLEQDKEVEGSFALSDIYPEAKSFVSKKDPILSLVVSGISSGHFSKTLGAFYKINQRQRVDLGELMIVSSSEAELKLLMAEKSKLDKSYDYPGVRTVFADHVPEHLQATSSPAWVVFAEGTQHVFEIGELNPSVIFDSDGSLIVPTSAEGGNDL